MKITDASLAHRATVFFLLAAVFVAGTAAYLGLPRESFPDITVPVVLVYTQYPGAAPAEVEKQVTDHVERELKGLKGLEELTSTSQESVSVVTVEFESGTDIDAALSRVRDRVDLAEAEFPDDAEEAIVQEISFSDIPIIQVNLSGDVGPVVLKELAEDLEEELEVLPGVLRVNLVGSLEREVQVEVDPERLRSYGLGLADVVSAIAEENVSIPGGDLDLGEMTYAVRVPGEVVQPREIEAFVVKEVDDRPIYVRDVATVTYGFEDRVSYARVGGRESVALTVQKRQGANLIEVADAVKATVEGARTQWPEGIDVALLGDQSKEIRRMVLDLENNILSGLVLVVLVLMFVLGLRNAVFVGLAIPISMLLTFVAIQLWGTTLNMVVLFSLVLSVGMLVDNAVVVVENIYRHVDLGLPQLRAASVGTREVGAAIAVSTFTTVGAFFPLAFWPGVVGDFMSYLPVTVSCALLSSLLVAFTANPVLCGTWMRSVTAGGTARHPLLDRIGGLLLGSYRRILAWALDHRLATVGGTLLTFVVVVLLYGVLGRGVEFFPRTEPNLLFVDIEMPPGTRLEHTDRITQELEERLRDLPDLRVLAANVGAGSQADFGQSGGGDATAGRITLDLVDRHERSQSSVRTLEEARRRVAGLPGVTVTVDQPDEGPPVGAPLSIEVSGDDFAVLGTVSQRLRELVEDVPGLVSLDDDFDLARPEVRIVVDRTEAARLGLSTSQIATEVRTAMNGTEASVYRAGGDEVDVVVRFPEAVRQDLAALQRITLVNEDGDEIPLGVIARVERTRALTSINHKDQKRVVTISGDVTVPELAEPVRTEARRRIEAAEGLVPDGVSLGFAGQSEDEDEAKSFLSSAFLYGLLIVLGLMVGKFDSVMIPVIIMTSVVMSTIGVFIGLLVTHMPFGIIMTGLGVISLAGIVVNNAIVLLDYAEQLVGEGLPRREVVTLTGERRFRPVVLTAVTTILGLIPLSTGVEFDFHAFAFATGGESSQWWRGMGVAVIFGLAFATFLTLVLVPVLYDLLLELRERRAASRGEEAGDLGREPEVEAAG